MPNLCDVAPVFREREYIDIRRRLAESRARERAQQELVDQLLSNAYFRAALSLIEDEKMHQCYGGVDLIDDRIEDYMGGPMIWSDPSERCDIIPLLQRLGYDVLHFNDDSSCPMSVGWKNRRPSEEDAELYAKNGWTWHPPIVDDFESSHAAR